MAFTSIYFLIFVLICVLVYYVTPIKWRWLVLLTASYVFYLLSSAGTLIFLIATTVVTFVGGILTGNLNTAHKEYMAAHKAELTKEERKQKKNENQKKKRRIIVIALVIDFGILATLKYFRYYLGALGISLFDAGILIPLGISFYTFQSAAYIFDIYRGNLQPDRNLLKFALFTSFFPQIIQGPISRHNQLAEQLYRGNAFDYSNLTHGAQLILWGFFKKLIIADRIAVVCNEVFDGHDHYSGLIVLTALLFYTVQIYADFSGGIDIARGVARCMGITMAHNFMRPYFSDSLSDFWNRWHISLSHWCRDYIFYPVAMSKFFGKMGKNLRSVFGDRGGKLFPVIIAQYSTFITIGLWHGAEFKYIAYGLYNGTIIVLGLILEPQLKSLMEKLHIEASAKWWKGFQIIRTFLIVMCGRVFPRAASFTVALSMFFSIFRPDANGPFVETIASLGLTGIDYLILLAGCIIWFLISLCEEREMRANGGTGAEGFRLWLDQRPLAIRWAILIMGLAFVLALGVYGPGYDASAFIYRGF